MNMKEWKMNKVLIGAALLAGVGLGAAGSAFSQTPPPPPGGPGGPDRGPGMWHEWDHMGPGGHGMHGMRRHPPHAAVFAFTRGDNRVMIKCADDEPTRAC